MTIIPLVKEDVVDKTYIKLCVNKAHMGPVDMKVAQKRSATKLSAAANRVRLRADFTVSPVSKVTEENNGLATGNKSYLLLANSEELSSIEVSRETILLFQAWSLVFNQPGTSPYCEKIAEFVKAQASVYRSLGINPSCDRKPELNSQQRQVYNQVVGPYGFDYWEYHMAYKIEGQKRFERTKTYRSLRPLGIDELIRKLSVRAGEIEKEINLSVKASN